MYRIFSMTALFASIMRRSIAGYSSLKSMHTPSRSKAPVCLFGCSFAVSAFESLNVGFVES